MRTINLAEITAPHDLPPLERCAFYNIYDCCLTYEIHLAQQPELDSIAQDAINFTFSLQRVALAMMLHGILIDQHEKDRMLLTLEAAQTKVLKILNIYTTALWGKPLNPGSPQQKSNFLYNFLALPPQTIYNKATGKMRITTNRSALEYLKKTFPKVTPIITAILAYQDVKKAAGILHSGIDSDSRMRSTFVVAGPKTGRMASRKNIFGRGSNFQNWREGWRIIFTTGWGPMPDRNNFTIPEEHKALKPVFD